MKNTSKILKKLRNGQKLSTLSAAEMKLYIAHRVQTALKKKVVLSPRELTYLLCETGFGGRRLDPGIIEVALDQRMVIRGGRPVRHAEDISKLKSEIALSIEKKITSEKLAFEVKKLLLPFADNLSVIQSNPFVFRYKIGDIALRHHVLNGQWLLPDDHLTNLIKTAYSNKELLVISARKIHPLLFLVFRDAGIIGNNIFSTFIAEQEKSEIDGMQNELKQKTKDFFFPGLYFNEPVEVIGDGFEGGVGRNQVKTLLTKIIPKFGHIFRDKFLRLNLGSTDSLLWLVKSIARQSHHKECEAFLKRRSTLITNLKKIKKITF